MDYNGEASDLAPTADPYMTVFAAGFGCPLGHRRAREIERPSHHCGHGRAAAGAAMAKATQKHGQPPYRSEKPCTVSRRTN